MAYEPWNDVDIATLIEGLASKLPLPTGTPTGSKFLRDDNSWQVPPSGGGGDNKGTALLDFGAFPGASDASVAVTGQAAIVAGSIVRAWLRPEATADHSADEHLCETIAVHAGNIVQGTGFTVYGLNTSQLSEPIEPGTRGGSGGRGTRIFGRWSIAWQWS